MKKLFLVLASVMVCSGLLFADSYKSITYGSAALNCKDGEQTVEFSNGASYTGNFMSCRPVSGFGIYKYNGTVLSGYFTASGDQVSLEKDGYKVILEVRIVPSIR